MFEQLKPQQPDALLALIGAFRADERREKVDLGVGVYRDANGGTPVLRAVKRAEQDLFSAQETKAYLGPEGNIRFAELLAPLVLGEHAGTARFAAVQTPGGTGALRLAAELIAMAAPGARLWLGTPSWPNHLPLMKAAGLEVRTYRHFDPTTQRLCFDETLAALESASPGDVVLLHGCCHNPTGTDFSSGQWRELAELMARRGLLPFIDLAYQGLGDGLEQDATGLHAVLSRNEEALVAYSCDKNFGLYRERTGALFVCSRDAKVSQAAQSHVLTSARASWSMPPDHGAAVVAHILDSDVLRTEWRAELEEMRLRIAGIRQQLAAADPLFEAAGRQRGMFAQLPLSRETIENLRKQDAIYMAGSGRINLCGLTSDNLDHFVGALRRHAAAAAA